MTLLTPAQETRVVMARNDCDAARTADLAAMDVSAIVLTIERLRGSLDDVLRLVAELAR